MFVTVTLVVRLHCGTRCCQVQFSEGGGVARCARGFRVRGVKLPPSGVPSSAEMCFTGKTRVEICRILNSATFIRGLCKAVELLVSPLRRSACVNVRRVACRRTLEPC